MRITARFLPVALIAAFVSACADAPTSTVGFAPNQPSMHVVPIAAPTFELLTLCKAGPVGTYTFNATATHPVLRDATTGAIGQTAATYTIVVSAGSTIDVGGTPVAGACYNFSGHNYIAIAGGTIAATVTVTESGIPAGIDFDRVVTYQNTSGTVTSSSSTTNSASGQIGGIGGVAALGAGLLFYNVVEPPPPPPPGLEGCTPGYWKQDQHFDSWPAAYTQNTLINTALSTTIFPATMTLLDALNANGGGINALARHAAAALLNAASLGVDYPMTVAQVQAAVDGAGTIEARKDVFATNNELGCPLN